MKPESSIVRRIVAKVREHYPTAYIRKLSDRFNRGLPDLIIVFASQGATCFLAVEVKTDTGRTTPLQSLEGDDINRIGSTAARWIVARSADDVLGAMKELCQ